MKALVIALMLVGGPALAKDRDRAAKRKVVEIPAQVIQGTKQQPEAVYVIHRSKVDVDFDRLTDELAPKTMQSPRR